MHYQHVTGRSAWPSCPCRQIPSASLLRGTLAYLIMPQAIATSLSSNLLMLHTLTCRLKIPGGGCTYVHVTLRSGFVRPFTLLAALLAWDSRPVIYGILLHSSDAHGRIVMGLAFLTFMGRQH